MDFDDPFLKLRIFIKENSIKKNTKNRDQKIKK